MSITIEGTPIIYNSKAKERTLYKEIEQRNSELQTARERITELEKIVIDRDKRIAELTVVLKAARRKTRSRKIWKTKEAEGL